MFHVIEPDLHVRDFIKAAIESIDYGVSLFATPDAYLDYFNSPDFTAPIAIISADLMPRKNCFELAKIVRHKIPNQKILVLSGSIPKGRNSELIKHSCHKLYKPFRLEALFSLLEALCLCEKECRQCNPARVEDECKYGLKDSCPHYNE